MSRRHSLQEFTLNVHKEPVRKEKWTKGSNQGLGFRRTHYLNIMCFVQACRPILSSAIKLMYIIIQHYSYQGQLQSWRRSMHKTARNKALVHFPLLQPPQAKWHTKRLFFLDFLPNNHGFLGHLSFPMKQEKKKKTQTLLM